MKMSDYQEKYDDVDEFEGMTFLKLKDLVESGEAVTVVGKKTIKKRDGQTAVFLKLKDDKVVYTTSVVAKQFATVPDDFGGDTMTVKFVKVKSKDSKMDYIMCVDA